MKKGNKKNDDSDVVLGIVKDNHGLAPKRASLDAERDRILIAQMYLQGHQQIEIAKKLNERYCPEGTELKEGGTRYTLTQQTISVDIRRIQKAWVESSIRDFDKAKGQELAKIDEIEREAWVAWHRSIGERKVETETTGTIKQTVIRKENINGDPRYMDIMLRCIEKRCALLGLDAPKKHEITDNRIPEVMKQKDIVDELIGIIQNQNGHLRPTSVN